jgi:hypothetical protein
MLVLSIYIIIAKLYEISKLYYHYASMVLNMALKQPEEAGEIEELKCSNCISMAKSGEYKCAVALTAAIISSVSVRQSE